MDHLYLRAKNGDLDAEQKIYQLLFARFKIVAKHRIGDHEDAKDVAQDACMTVLRKYKSEIYTISFEAWAYGVLRMKIGNYIQLARTRRECRAPDNSTERADDCSNEERYLALQGRLSNCLRKLVRKHPRYARVLNLIYQGYRTDEISERLSVKPNNVHVILSRGRSLLRSCLEMGSV